MARLHKALGSDASRFVIRDAVEEDVPALARLHVKTFNETHRPVLRRPSIKLRERQWREAFGNVDSAWFCLVVQNESGDLVGFAKGVMPYGEIGDYEGELNKIYLLRRYQERGLGRRLLCQVAARFLSLGVESMCLYGWAANPNNGFYEHMGAERMLSPNGDFHGGYGWRDLQVLARQHRGH